MAPALGRPVSRPQTRFSTRFRLQVPGAAPLPPPRWKGVRRPSDELPSPGLAAQPQGAGASSGPFASVLGGRRGERPPRSPRGNAGGDLGHLQRCQPCSLPGRDTRGSRASWGFMSGMRSAVSTEAARSSLRGPNFAHHLLRACSISSPAAFSEVILTIPPRTTSPSHFPYATPFPAPSTSSKSPTFSLSRPLS